MFRDARNQHTRAEAEHRRGKKETPPSRTRPPDPDSLCAYLNIHGRNIRMSEACQAVDGANVPVAVDRHELMIIQQDIGLVTPVTIEPGYRVTGLNQQLG